MKELGVMETTAQALRVVVAVQDLHRREEEEDLEVQVVAEEAWVDQAEEGEVLVAEDCKATQ